MSTTVGTVISQLATLVQEDGSNYGGTDWSSGLWSVSEIITYLNAACKEFVLQSQIVKLIAAVASVTGQRIYADPAYTMAIDRIAFNNRPTYRTTRLNLDRENIRWRTLAGVPRQYHQDQLSTKMFEMDRAPSSAMTGSGYQALGLYGTVRYMMHNAVTASDGAINASSANLSSATIGFVPGDFGKTIAIAGAGSGGQTLVTTILTYSSATAVILATNALTSVTNASLALDRNPGFYSVTGSPYGVFRYSLGTPAINGILPHDRPYAGTLRQMLSGLTNFEVLATRLMDDIAQTSDLMRVPDYCLPYIKFWTLYQMLSKEGEGQDLARAKYSKMRFDFGVQLFRRYVSAAHDKVTQPQGTPQ
jgi:hypothetical protein